MKKVLGATLVCLALVFSQASASPLMDYGEGKGSVDVSWRPSGLNLSGNTNGHPRDKDNPDAAITLGIGHNFAFQYRHYAAESEYTPGHFRGIASSANWKLTTDEFTVLYKLDKNISAFAGMVSAKGDMNAIGVFRYTTDTRNLWQVGFQLVATLAPKTTGWLRAGAGNDLTNWEAGLSYRLSDNLELGATYREIEAKNLHINSISQVSAKSKGLGFGLTLKF